MFYSYTSELNTAECRVKYTPTEYRRHQASPRPLAMNTPMLHLHPKIPICNKSAIFCNTETLLNTSRFPGGSCLSPLPRPAASVCPFLRRVSTKLNKFPGDFQETPGGISRKIQDMFVLLRPAMYRIYYI